jgi:hypothetical protein
MALAEMCNSQPALAKTRAELLLLLLASAQVASPFQEELEQMSRPAAL